jgi:hypothetical protein
MKNIEVVKRNIKDAIKQSTGSGLIKSSNVAKAAKRLKKLFYISSLIGIGFLVNYCSLGYIASEPVYYENVRPARPSDLHIWIDGDWSYNRQSQAYVQSTGYWVKSDPNRTYISGSWQSNQHGKYWNKGHWQNNKHSSGKHSR